MRQSPLGVVTKKPASLWLLPARRGVLALGVYLPRLVTAACYLVHSLRILCGVSLYRPLSPAYYAGITPSETLRLRRLVSVGKVIVSARTAFLRSLPRSSGRSVAPCRGALPFRFSVRFFWIFEGVARFPKIAQLIFCPSCLDFS